MPADTKNNGLRAARPATDPSAAGLPGLAPAAPPQPADAGLSAAFRQALGGKPGDTHIPGASMKRSQEIARQAKAARPGATHKGASRKTHIGPRSGHK